MIDARGTQSFFINIKQRGPGPIILRKYMRKYGRIAASYMDDLGCRLEALGSCSSLAVNTTCRGSVIISTDTMLDLDTAQVSTSDSSINSSAKTN